MSDEPKWRKDFPLEWEADNYTTRREFTKFLVLISGATFLGNGYFVLRRYQERHEAYSAKEVAAVDEIPSGGVKLFRYPTENDPAILLRLPDGRYVAYMQRCTHLSCPVLYNGRDRLECPCHNGAFDAETGKVLEGPPPRPLPQIIVREENGKIIAEGVQGT
jgi:Rieske Fe-S protein